MLRAWLSALRSYGGIRLEHPESLTKLVEDSKDLDIPAALVRWYNGSHSSMKVVVITLGKRVKMCNCGLG